MAFRGRGRGRGGFGGGGFRAATQEAFVLFPLQVFDNLHAPDENEKIVEKEIASAATNSKLQNLWKSSYCIADGKSADLSTFMKLSSDYVPAELAKVSNTTQEQRNRRSVRWKPKTDVDIFDYHEKLEKRRGQDDDSGKEKKDDENEEEDDEKAEEDDESYSTDGDYEQNIDFDDDEDDYNMDDGGDDEPTY